MATYQLRIHSREVFNSPLGYHTGYDLITYVDGVPTRIDFYFIS